MVETDVQHETAPESRIDSRTVPNSVRFCRVFYRYRHLVGVYIVV
jgi:hypothetical protein